MSNYYLIGTKYGATIKKDILPFCLHRNVIAIGFLFDTDLSNYYCKNEQGLDIFLRNKNEQGSTIGQMKRFMNIKAGDIIALKGTGSPIGNKARLDIVGYAVVTERDGKIYSYDGNFEFPQSLGHTLNVDFFRV